MQSFHSKMRVIVAVMVLVGCTLGEKYANVTRPFSWEYKTHITPGIFRINSAANPCQDCREKEKEGEPINCEWICDESCADCDKKQKVTSTQLFCEKLCGQPPLPCRTCKRREKKGLPAKCDQLCETPCLECRRDEQQGNVVNCHDICESPCRKCKESGGSAEDCAIYCGKEGGGVKQELRAVNPCQDCREKEKEGEPINCEWICDEACTDCEEKEKEANEGICCEKLCGQPPLPCRTCKRREKMGLPANCDQLCENPCLECRRDEQQGNVVDCQEICESPCRKCKESGGSAEDCAIYCGKEDGGEKENLPNSCEDCREKEKEGEPINCEWICDEACAECKEKEEETSEEICCEKLCGQPPLPCRTCKRREKMGLPANCDQLCETPCLECRRDEQQGNVVNCHEICESPCRKCKESGGWAEDCAIYCSKEGGGVKQEFPLPCLECRQKEMMGQTVNCVAICESPCMQCKQRKKMGQTVLCEGICGEALNCKECMRELLAGKEQDVIGEVDLYCEFTCAYPCRQCLLEVDSEEALENCENVCGTDDFYCSKCGLEMEEPWQCIGSCVHGCNYCLMMERSMGKPQYCGRFCGDFQQYCRKCKATLQEPDMEEYCSLDCDDMCLTITHWQLWHAYQIYCGTDALKFQKGLEYPKDYWLCEDCLWKKKPVNWKTDCRKSCSYLF